jgi:predicted 3-demethylubiquinone-9 3-methyltransferase (glyoxalase superfamily)
MPKISPHLWFDKDAKQAAELYTSIISNSKIKSVKILDNTPSGSVDLVSVDLAGQNFRFISAGPLFKFTPAVSFLVACDTKEEVDRLWAELSKDGTPLMELGAYPFSERYAWTRDRFGLSWQLMFMGNREVNQKITPTLMFVGQQVGKAEAAIQLYTSLFRDSNVGHILRYDKNDAPDREGTIKHAGFTLEGQQFAAMDSAHGHNFNFNEAISFMVHCETQEEIDYYWSNLSAVPQAEQCGWLKDKFGVSWQIVPTLMDKMFQDNDRDKISRVTQAFLKMKKFDIAKLEEAARGRSAA